MTRLSHSVKDLDNHSSKHCEFYEEKIPNEEYEILR